MALEPSEAAPIAGELLSLLRKEKRKHDRIDRWARWNHDLPHRPRQATREYQELVARSQAPWGDLIIRSVAQTLYVEGYRRPSAPTDSTGWTIWQANAMDARQIPLHKAILTFGIAYGLGLPGKTMTGDPMPQLRGVSPRDAIAVYDDPAVDDWPIYFLRVVRRRKGLQLVLYDDTFEHSFPIQSTVATTPSALPEISEHGAGVCPAVRYTNRFDLEGRASGEIEPFIPLLGKIDQTSFDRLVVQRFASWIVRTIAGMSVAESAAAANETFETAKMRLRVEDLLTAEDPDTKFGSLPATPLDGFINAHDADLRDLAAVSQTPAFELLGQMHNMSAEALAAAKASETAKSDEIRHAVGEGHEQFLRLGCHLAGDTEGAADFKAQVRWADTTIRSLAQAVDAYGKAATMLGVPPEALWPKIPGVTQGDVDEWKVLAKQAGGVEAVLNRILGGQQQQQQPAPPPAA